MNIIPPMGGDLAVAEVKGLTGLRLDPFRAYRFVVDVQGIFVGGFMSVEGIAAKTEVLKVREGGANGVEYKLPGQVTYGDLILTSGLTFTDPTWLWHRSTVFGKPLRKNGAIYLLDDLGVPTAWWNFFNAWPVAWIGPHFNATETLVAVQQFTLTYERIVKGATSSAAGAAAYALEKLL